MRLATSLAALVLLSGCSSRATAPPPVVAVTVVAAPPPPVIVAPAVEPAARAEARIIAPADRATFLAFLARLLRFSKHGPVSAARLDEVIEGDTEFSVNHDLGEDIYLFSAASLYIADVDNDGRSDYLLIDRNNVGMHNDTIHGVYDDAGADTLTELPFYETYRTSLFSPDATDADVQLPNHRGYPAFIEVTDRGTVMHFADSWYLDAAGEGVAMWADRPADRSVEVSATYLWKDAHVSELAHTKKTTKL